MIITGGSKGIGLACAKAFAAEGARVAIISRDPANLRAAQVKLDQCGYSVTVHTQDLASAEGCERAMAILKREIGPLDILLNCAGAAKKYPLNTMVPAHFLEALQAKFTPYLNMQHQALRSFARQRAIFPRQDKAM
ncbi:SDR family oxidoreductase [Pseudomonas entomophila]|uniref:SDR family NAD(P)-dependent oxidoreductase n=1 Tax=Pseudomonas sp. RIT-PI-S TaxID=3035295 RepID=UPI0021D9B761